MLSLFRTNQFLASVLFLPYLLLLRVSTWFFPLPGSVHDAGSGLAFRWLLDLTGRSGWLPLLVSGLLLFATAAWLTAFVIQSRLSREVTLFPGVFLILFCSLFPECLMLSPLHVSNLLLLAALSQLSATYKRYAIAGRLFNVGFWIAAASLFVPVYAFFLFFAFAGLSVLRAYAFREQLMLLVGFFAPYWLLFAALFWLDQAHLLLQHFQSGYSFLDLSGLVLQPWIPKLLLVGLLLLIVLFSLRQYVSKTSIKVQKTIYLFFWLLFTAGLAVPFQSQLGLAHVQLIAIPAGALLALNFNQLSTSWSELLHLLLLLCAAYFQLADSLSV